jgi:hypothetical protein
MNGKVQYRPGRFAKPTLDLLSCLMTVVLLVQFVQPYCASARSDYQQGSGQLELRGHFLPDAVDIRAEQKSRTDQVRCVSSDGSWGLADSQNSDTQYIEQTETFSQSVVQYIRLYLLGPQQFSTSL